VTRPHCLELGDGTRVPVLYEDRAVLAVDKPAGWLLAPAHWLHTRRNLQAALESGIAGGAAWARRRNLKYLRFVHRLDAETSGVLLLARSPGALGPLSRLFASRAVDKRYLAVVVGTPRQAEWTCTLPLSAPSGPGARARVERHGGRPAETGFRVLARVQSPRFGPLALLEARPLTGRTHQIRVHLAAARLPVLGDALYGGPACPEGLGLRAVSLAYRDPFTRRAVRITAPVEEFLRRFGFEAAAGDRMSPAAAP
jgi:23S rRNA pseudouridine1911/1915/1917 synthase